MAKFLFVYRSPKYARTKMTPEEMQQSGTVEIRQMEDFAYRCRPVVVKEVDPDGMPAELSPVLKGRGFSWTPLD